MQEQINKQMSSRCSPEILLMTWAEKELICKEWRASGLSKKKFCANKNINVSTFAGWCLKLWPIPLQPSNNLLCPVDIKNMGASCLTEEPIVLEVLFPNAMVAKVQSTLGQFSYLLKEIVNATSVIR